MFVYFFFFTFFKIEVSIGVNKNYLKFSLILQTKKKFENLKYKENLTNNKYK